LEFILKTRRIAIVECFDYKIPVTCVFITYKLRKCANFSSLRSENIDVGKNKSPFLKNINAIDSDKTGKEMENIDGVPNIDYRCFETIDASMPPLIYNSPRLDALIFRIVFCKRSSWIYQVRWAEEKARSRVPCILIVLFVLFTITVIVGRPSVTVSLSPSTSLRNVKRKIK